MHRLVRKLAYSGRTLSSLPLVKADGATTMQSSSKGHFLRSFGQDVTLEDVHEHTTRKNLRLSREKRADLVEKFVYSYTALNKGKFPSLSAVVKETGGSRSTVKDILDEIRLRVKAETSEADEDPNKLESADNELGSFVAEGISMPASSASDLEHAAKATMVLSNNVDGVDRITPKNVDVDGRSMEHLMPGEEITNVKREKKKTLWERLHAGTSSGHQGSSSEATPEGSERMGKVLSPGSSSKYLDAKDKTSKDYSAVDEKLLKLFERMPKLRADETRSLAKDRNNVAIGERSDEGNDVEFKSLDYPEQDGTESPSGVTARDVLGVDMQISRNEVFVTCLPPDATEADLENAFQDCGKIVSISAGLHPKNPELKHSFGFVRFETEEGCQKALGKRVVIKGVKVKVFPKKISYVSSFDRSPTSNHDIAKHIGSDSSVAASNSSLYMRNIPDCEGYPVLVESVPESVLYETEKVLASHGEIVSVQFEAGDSGAYSVRITFKSEAAKESALASHWIHLGGKPFRVHRRDSPETTVIRISNISTEIDVDTIFNTCNSCGPVQKIKSRGSGIFDVYFDPKEAPNMISVLDRLNEVHMHKRRWQAQPAPRLYPHISTEFQGSATGQKWLKAQQSDTMEKFEEAIREAKLHLADIKYLFTLQWRERNSDFGDAPPS